MKSSKTVLLACLLAAALFACNNAAPNPEATATETATDSSSAATSAANETVLTLNAMFVGFSLGDAEHYNFKDKDGKEWDFGGNDDTSVSFGQELPEAEANETNQGWASNKALQGKWFDLKYAIRQQPQYLEGPIGDVPVIIEAKQVQ